MTATLRTLLPLLTFLLPAHRMVAQRIEAVQPFGGMAGVQRLIENELRYPVAALEAGIKGEVTVVVGVSADGTVQGMQVWRGLSPECDAEALRLARLVRWQATTADEARGSADHYIAVPFDPVRYKRWMKSRAKREGPVFDLPASDTLAVYLPKQLDGQVAPGIPGGFNGFGRYLTENMRYPAEAYRRSIEGTVRLQFTVETSGAATNVLVLEELGGGCTAEAVRLVEHCPWLPGTKDGKRVRAQQEVSIRFSLPQAR